MADTEKTVPHIGENRIILNQDTMRAIVADWLNRKQADDPDLEVTDIYVENNQFHVVTVAKG
jgi:hypothetical protein